MRALIDTNVLIDLFGRRQPYFKWWSCLSVMQEFGDIELWVAPQSFADAFYILHKQVPSDKLQQAFLDSLDFLNVCSVGMQEVAETAKRSWNDYEDCMIALCGENLDVDILLSRDESGFTNTKIPVYSPEAFFNMLENEYGLVYEEIEI